MRYSDITDGTRWVFRPSTWDSVEEALEDAAASYRRALWTNQDDEVMIFAEKDAISGVLMPVTRRWDVPLGILRGYASETFCWTIATEIQQALTEKDAVYLYQLGDHDPSGVDAWRSFEVTVRRMLEESGTSGDDVEFTRLAVTPEQIDTMGLPTRPTKRSDTRAAGFTGGSVEVDAIRAPTLREIVNDAIERHIDQEALRITQIAEESEREILTRMAGGETEEDVLVV